MIGCNIIMWILFTMALKQQNSLYVLILNSAGNMITTGIVGSMLLQEPITIKWIFGVLMITLGTLIIKSKTYAVLVVDHHTYLPFNE